MSSQLISRSADLKRLRDEGYDVEVRSSFLLVKSVPYVNSKKQVANGTLVSTLRLAGNVTDRPDTHVAYFMGDHPCNKDGAEIAKIKHSSGRQELAPGLAVDHSFSGKPNGGYADYYDKMTTYVAIISGPAQSIDPSATAKTFPVIKAEEEDSVFNYVDTASSRAGIMLIAKKLELGKIAIVGIGGTGSYVLDLIAKTPVKEIHLFDGDVFSQHNAFRSPGAPSVDSLTKKPNKAIYHQGEYSKLHRHIIAHESYIDLSNVDQLHGMDFVFLCLDRGAARKLIVSKLEEFGVPFIDVGMGVQQVDGSLGGILRVTSSTVEQRERARARLPFSDSDDNNDYSQNIQTADLNALNAALAVIKWKKFCGFYRDLDSEYHSTYTIDGNALTNEVPP